MPAPGSQPRVGKGSGLGKKAGPLPLYGWVMIAVAIVGYFVFFRHSSSAASSQAQQTNAQTPDAALGNIPQAGSPGDSGGATSSMQDAYGMNQADSALLSALIASESNVSLLAQGQIDSLKNQTTTAPIDTTTAATGQQPGGSNAPTTTFSSPAAANAAYGAAASDLLNSGPVTYQGTTYPNAYAAATGMLTSTNTGQPRETPAAPFGGVVSTRKTSSGVTITTYASGRVVEQAPGKSAYVAHK